MPEEPTRAVLYRRTSTDEQRLGLAAQLDQLQAEVERRGWDAEVVTDKVSGKVAAEEREHLGPALDSLRAGDILAVAKLDRLSRSVSDFTRLVTRAEREGWGIVILDLGIDMTTHHGRLVAHILMAIAEWEREMIVTRIKEGMAKSDKRMGHPPGRPGNRGAKPADIPEETLAFVRDQHAEGKSAREIAHGLNTYGHETPRKRRWHATTVLRLLTRMEVA